MTVDLLPNGSSVLGGTAAYAGSLAHALGQRTGIVAAVGPDADLTALVNPESVGAITLLR